MANDLWMGLTHSIKKNFDKIEERLMTQIKESKENSIVDELKSSIEGIREVVLSKIVDMEMKILDADKSVGFTKNELSEKIDKLHRLVKSSHESNEQAVEDIAKELHDVKMRPKWKKQAKHQWNKLGGFIKPGEEPHEPKEEEIEQVKNVGTSLPSLDYQRLRDLPGVVTAENVAQFLIPPRTDS